LEVGVGGRVEEEREALGVLASFLAWATGQVVIPTTVGNLGNSGEDKFTFGWCVSKTGSI
jgi:hypothetical protein